jgi:ABC-2 type transport system ATP-binding protein
VGDGAFRKKSGDKMKEILAGGVTGILVSHSIAQVREMCNKILWLDHGRQVAFSDNVKLYCDAYEEFLQTKKLPQGEDDVKTLAKGWAKRKRAERARKERTEKQKLEAILEAGEKDAALKAALAVINKRNPELLTEEAKQKLQ